MFRKVESHLKKRQSPKSEIPYNVFAFFRTRILGSMFKLYGIENVDTTWAAIESLVHVISMVCNFFKACSNNWMRTPLFIFSCSPQ